MNFFKYYVDEFARVTERLTQFEEQETIVPSTARDSARFENIHFTYVPPSTTIFRRSIVK